MIKMKEVYLKAQGQKGSKGSALGFPDCSSTAQIAGAFNVRVRNGNGCATPLWPPDSCMEGGI